RTVGPRIENAPLDRAKLRQKVVESFRATDTKYWQPGDAHAPEAERALVQSLRASMYGKDDRPLDLEQQSVLAVVLWVVNGFFHDGVEVSLIDWWVAAEGLPFALEALAGATGFRRN